MPKKEPVQQLYDNVWYKINDEYTHECCDCGLVHSVKYKLDNGNVMMQWNVNSKETRKARKVRKETGLDPK